VTDSRKRARSALFAVAGSLIGALVYATGFAAIPVGPYLLPAIAGIALTSAGLGAAFPSIRSLVSASIGFLTAIVCSLAITVYAVSRI